MASKRPCYDLQCWGCYSYQKEIVWKCEGKCSRKYCRECHQNNIDNMKNSVVDKRNVIACEGCCVMICMECDCNVHCEAYNGMCTSVFCKTCAVTKMATCGCCESTECLYHNTFSKCEDEDCTSGTCHSEDYVYMSPGLVHIKCMSRCPTCNLNKCLNCFVEGGEIFMNFKDGMNCLKCSEFENENDNNNDDDIEGCKIGECENGDEDCIGTSLTLYNEKYIRHVFKCSNCNLNKCYNCFSKNYEGFWSEPWEYYENMKCAMCNDDDNDDNDDENKT